MLYIEDIDDNTFKMYGDVVSQEGKRILPKLGVTAKAKEPAYNETTGRIGIWDSEKAIWLLAYKPVNEIDLGGTVHATADAFVVAFNIMVAIP